MKKKDYLNFDEVIFDEAARNKDLRQLDLPLSRAAFIFVVAVALLVGGTALGRIINLNSVNGGFYRERAAANVNKEAIMPAPRGIITDRYGEVLASNASALSIFVDAVELRQGSHEAELAKLAEILSLNGGELRQLIIEADLRRQNQILVARNVAVEEGIAARGLNQPFIKVVNDYTREYIDGAVFAHVVGYTGPAERGRDIVGKTGLEAYYEEKLRGQDGASWLYRDAYGNVIEEKIVREPELGQKLTTTLDADFQRYFYNNLSSGLQALGRSAGVGLAIDPRNGEVLALVSLPSFDNNLFAKKDKSRERVNLLQSSGQPLFNRAVSGAYTPGSAIKPLVALAALRENLISPEDAIFSAGFIEIPNPYNAEKPSRFLDWKPHGWVDLHSALARSSNIYFYAIGGGFENINGLGIDRLKEYWVKLGFGSKTGLDLGGENVGFLPDPEEKETRTGDIWRIGDTYNVSIGQGDFLVTPVQLLNFISSIGNGGKIHQPRLVREADFEIVNEATIDYSDWAAAIQEVQRGMEDAVRKPYGTASLLSVLPVKAAGKTGSAQVANNTRTNAFFVGYMPAENPQIAVLVLIENAREGSLNAVPIAKDVFEWYYYNRIVKTQ